MAHLLELPNKINLSREDYPIPENAVKTALMTSETSNKKPTLNTPIADGSSYWTIFSVWLSLLLKQKRILT
jgi:hypothetical protein